MFRNPSLSSDRSWTDTYWPLHTPLKRETLTLSTAPSKVLEGHDGARKCAFWKKFLPQLANGTFDGSSGDFFHEQSQPQKSCELECCSNTGLVTGPKSNRVLFSAMVIIFFKFSNF